MKKIKTGKPSKREMRKIAAIINVLFFQNTAYKTGKPGMLAVYWIPLNAITSQPEPPELYGLPGDTATATGAWTVVADTGFIKLNNDLFKGSKLMIKSEGALNSPTFKSNVECEVIGLDTELVERHRDMAGVPGVLVIMDNTCPTDTYWVMGCACGYCYMSFAFDSDLVGGTAGKITKIIFEANCTPYLWSQELNSLPLSTETGV